jgi:hypothetical protein
MGEGKWEGKEEGSGSRGRGKGERRTGRAGGYTVKTIVCWIILNSHSIINFVHIYYNSTGHAFGF